MWSLRRLREARRLEGFTEQYGWGMVSGRLAMDIYVTGNDSWDAELIPPLAARPPTLQDLPPRLQEIARLRAPFASPPTIIRPTHPIIPTLIHLAECAKLRHPRLTSVIVLGNTCAAYASERQASTLSLYRSFEQRARKDLDQDDRAFVRIVEALKRVGRNDECALVRTAVQRPFDRRSPPGN